MAKKTITQRIALEGGDEITRQLQGLGKEGQAAFKKLSDAANASGLLNRFSAQVDALKAKAAQLGDATRRVGESFNNLGGSVTTSARRIATIGAIITGIAGGFGALVKSAANASDELQDLADSLGITTERLQNAAFAAQLNSVDTDKYKKALVNLQNQMAIHQRQALTQEHSLRDLNREFGEGKVGLDGYVTRLTDLNRKNDDATDAFTRLGISTKRADGTMKDALEVQDEIADRFKGIEDGSTKAGLALELFGTRNIRMVNLLNLGSDAISKFEATGQRIAPALGPQQRAALASMNDAFDVLGKAAKSTSQQLAAVIAPTAQRILEAFTQAVVDNRDSLVALAETIAENVRPVVDDLIAVLQGRDVDVKNSAILKFRDGVVEFGIAVKQTIVGIVVPAFTALLQSANVLAQGMNSLFGTDINGQTIIVTLLISKLTGLTGVFTALVGTIGTVVRVIAVLAGAFGGVELALVALGVAVGFVFGTALIAAVQKASDLVSTFATALVEAFTSIPDLIGAAFASVGDFIGGVFQSLVDAATSVGQGLVSVFQTALASIGSFFTSWFEAASGFLNQILSLAKQVGNAMSQAFSSGEAGGGAVPSFAGGGPVRGPGTGTSDSIWARISSGEFVQRFAAVRKYGVDVMAALNSLALPRDAVRGLLRGASLSGFAERMSAVVPVPHLAAGGMPLAAAPVSGGRPIHLNFGGPNVFGPLQASGDVAEELERFVIRSQLTSNGRKPSWFK